MREVNTKKQLLQWNKEHVGTHLYHLRRIRDVNSGVIEEPKEVIDHVIWKPQTNACLYKTTDGVTYRSEYESGAKFTLFSEDHYVKVSIDRGREFISEYWLEREGAGRRLKELQVMSSPSGQAL
jgi:hypothetical protein